MSTPSEGDQPDPFADDRDDHRRLIEAIDQPGDILDDLGDLLERAPAAFVSFVARTVMSCPTCADLFIADVGWGSPRPLRAVATAASYLQGRTSVDIVGIDLPRWLATLDDAGVTRGRRRLERNGAITWLLEVRLAGGQLISARLVIEPSVGALDGASIIDGTLDDLELLARALEPVASDPYRSGDLSTAADELVTALGRYRAALCDPRPGDPWPGNEPFVTWIIATLLCQADPRTRGAAA